MITPKRLPAAKIVRMLMDLSGTGTHLFSDKLKSRADRSLKVWGWSVAQYDEAVRVLRAHGYTAAVVYSCRKTSTSRSASGYQEAYRLWVA